MSGASEINASASGLGAGTGWPLSNDDDVTAMHLRDHGDVTRAHRFRERAHVAADDNSS